MAHINVAVGFEFWVDPVRWELKSNLLRPIQKEGEPWRGDAWKMRNELFHIKTGDIDGLVNFLNRWGQLWQERSFTLEQVWGFQEQWKSAVMGSFADQSRLIVFEMRSQYPHLYIPAQNIKHAIETTITLDLMRRVRFRLCARRDCRAPFAVESKHGRKFCSPYCGHLESVRRSRRKQRREGTK